MLTIREAMIAEGKPAEGRHLSPASLRWRKWRRLLSQVLVLGVAGFLLLLLAQAVRAGFAARGVGFNLDFLTQRAGFEISESITLTASGFRRFTSDMTNWQALLAGLINTLKVAVVAILLTTLLGTALGVARLSTNWLIRNLAFWVVEFVRNTPLLIQLVFWYVAVIAQLPILRNAPTFWGVIISKQGVWLPLPVISDPSGSWMAIGAVLLAILSLFLSRYRRILMVLALGFIGAAIIAGFRVSLDVPEAGRFRASGGIAASPEYAALLLAITVNTAAYLGEIVRGAIEALPRGQWEAAEALGMKRSHVIRDVILPQVFRVVLPSFGNQYITMAKNTSLGIAVGYPELFNVYGTVSNQTGRPLEGVLIATLIYLLLSWAISAAVNLVNARLKRARAR